jgi:hypothetical protein
MDVLSDTLAGGRNCRTLNVGDDVTRKCAAIDVDRHRQDCARRASSTPSQDVCEVARAVKNVPAIRQGRRCVD